MKNQFENFLTKQAQRLSEVETQEQLNLVRKAQMGDNSSRKKIVSMMRPLLASIIDSNYGASSIPKETLMSHCIGLLNDYIDTFDPSKGTKPSSYFYGNIQQKLKRFVAQNQNMARPSEQTHWRIQKLINTRNDLMQRYGRQPTSKELSDELSSVWKDENWSESAVDSLSRDMRVSVVGSTRVGETGEGSEITMQDITYVDEIHPMEEIRRRNEEQRLLNAINQLESEDDRKIILKTFGIGGYPKKSVTDIALELGMSNYSVMKKKEEVKEKIRKELGVL